jgi:hypothetical protein
MIAGPPPSSGPRWPFVKFPSWAGKRIFILGIAVAAAVAIGAALAITSAQQDRDTTISKLAPDVQFIAFGADRQEVRVGESAGVIFNVQNAEGRNIDGARVDITVEPAAGNTYLSISNKTVELPALHTDARTGEVEVSITATGTPAAEAVYVVKGTIVAEDTKTDVREFRLTIRQ